jgi:hypothetical protein
VKVELIQYYATLERGLSEAKRTNRPILFVTGAPHCAGVSGMWCPGKGKIDEGYLTHPEVIWASKNFVCIRLTSYENKDEQAFVEKITGNMVNTAFAFLNPDGTPAMAGRGTGRGPGNLFGSVTEMVDGMNRLAEKFPPGKDPGAPALPVTLSAKVGLAVAAADLQPLAVVISADSAKRAAMERTLAQKAWSPDFRGYFSYAAAAKPGEIPNLTGAAITEGIILVEPDYFGSAGKVVAAVTSDPLDENALSESMTRVMNDHIRIAKTRQELRAKGLAEGVFYETGIPVSGKGEAADRERYKKEIEAKRDEGS